MSETSTVNSEHSRLQVEPLLAAEKRCFVDRCIRTCLHCFRKSLAQKIFAQSLNDDRTDSSSTTSVERIHSKRKAKNVCQSNNDLKLSDWKWIQSREKEAVASWNIMSHSPSDSIWSYTYIGCRTYNSLDLESHHLNFPGQQAKRFELGVQHHRCKSGHQAQSTFSTIIEPRRSRGLRAAE